MFYQRKSIEEGGNSWFHQMTEKKALWRGSTRGVGNRESVRLQKVFPVALGPLVQNLAEQDPPEAVLEREAKRVLASRGQKRYSFTSNSPTSRPQGRSRSRFSETGSTVNQGIGTWTIGSSSATGPGPWIYMWRREKGRPMYSSMGKLYRLADMVKDQTICSDWETTCTVELLTKWPKENQDSRKFIDTTELDRKYSRGAVKRNKAGKAGGGPGWQGN
ncbi:hypothetical protein GGX14DRAFT_409319 [Mycena pura]|uniref:Uncharacterized protein n=1 Tax=Mycena pura TaxID=153505 RepID=A0AAD6UJC7_9AGAR|nr:hypothetical protein GGX14DRAFT_409319 [Mycena pura]